MNTYISIKQDNGQYVKNLVQYNPIRSIYNLDKSKHILRHIINKEKSFVFDLCFFGL